MALNKIEIEYRAQNQQFNQALSGMRDEVKTLNKEFALQQEKMKNTADDAEKLKAKLDNLTEQYKIQERVTQETNEAWENAKKLLGENSKEAQYWNNKLLDAEYAQEKLANKIKETDKAYQDSVREMSGFGKKLEELQKESQYLETDLKDIEKALAMDPGNMDLIEQKSKNLEKQMENTAQTVTELKAKQDKLDGDAYDKIKREVVLAEGKMKDLRNQIDKVDDSRAPSNLKNDLDDIGDTDLSGVMDGLLNQMDSPSLGNLAGAFSAAIPIGDTLSGALSAVLGMIDEAWKKTKEHASEAAILTASMDFLPKGSEKILQEAIDLSETYGIETQDALIAVRKQWMLNKSQSDAVNASVIEGANVIARKYSELDLSEIVTETNKVASALRISDEEALGLLNHMLDAGFPPDQIDTIAEYGKQWELAGGNAEEFSAILLSAVDVEPWNMDGLLDGIKEGRIQMSGFGFEIDETMSGMLEKAGWNQQKFQQLGKDIAEGGDKGTQSYREVANMLAHVDDKTLQNQLGVKIFGSLWENNGSDITETLTGMESKLTDASTAQQNLNSDIQEINSDPMVKAKQDSEAYSDGIAGIATQYLAAELAAGRYVDEGLLKLLGMDAELQQMSMHTQSAAALDVANKNLQENAVRQLRDETGKAFRYMNETTLEESNEMRKNALSNSEQMKTGVTDDTNKMKNDVKDDLNSIKRAASELKWKIPRPTIPKFSLQGSLSLQNGTVPKIQTTWYKDGGYANKATLFGMGEAGGEGIVPLEGQHMYPFADAVAERITENHNVTNINISASINNDMDIEELGRKIDRHLNRQSHEIRIKNGK